VGAVGAASAEALARAGVCVDLLAEEASGAGLAEAFIALGVERGTRVLLPGAKEPRPELRERLAAAGFEPVPLALYETRPLAPDLSGAEVVVLASPSAVRACEGAIAALPSSARMVAIGETTASALRERGLGARTHVAAYPSEGGIVDACAEAARALGRERG
jgi:uroporphyrinogen-III synthase